MLSLQRNSLGLSGPMQDTRPIRTLRQASAGTPICSVCRFAPLLLAPRNLAMKSAPASAKFWKGSLPRIQVMCENRKREPKILLARELCTMHVAKSRKTGSRVMAQSCLPVSK